MTRIRTLAAAMLTVAAAALVRPAPALACAVCFGAADGPVADATNLAVLAMLGVTSGVLGSFAGFFVYLMKRARTVAGLEPAGESAGSRPDGARAEGTAS